MKRINYLTLVSFIFLTISYAGAQSWNLGGNSSTNPLGFEKFGLTDPLDLQFITDDNMRMSLTKEGRLGLGIGQPRAWQEIKYCPPLNQQENGLVVTLHHCNNGFGQADVFNPDVIGGGIHVYHEPSNTPPPPLVFKVPFSFLTGNNTTVASPLYNSNAAPMFWLRKQSPTGFWMGSGPDRFDTKFIVMPDGSCGINIAQPRAALDVRGSNGTNRPAAIIGSRSIGTSTFDQTTGLLKYYTQQVHFVPILKENGYNEIVQANDQGMFFSDGKGADGANASSAFVLAPWAASNNCNVGGMRMDANGNTEFHGSLRATSVKVDAKWWCDFVFDKDYELRSISDLENYIKENKHLPGVPSEAEVLENGIDLAEMQTIQQQKIEELTLYIIELKKQIDALTSESSNK